MTECIENQQMQKAYLCISLLTKMHTNTIQSSIENDC